MSPAMNETERASAPSPAPIPGSTAAPLFAVPPHRSADLSAGVLMVALLAADVAVFLLQKVSSSGGHDESLVAFFVTLMRTPTLWLAVSLMPVQLWLWTRILARADIGWAYPVTSLAYPLTMILAALVLSERYDWHVWIGALLITAGAAVLGPPQRSEPPAGGRVP